MRLWLLLMAMAQADNSLPRRPSLFSVLDESCRLLAAGKYRPRDFRSHFGVDHHRQLPPQNTIPSTADYVRFVPLAPAFAEMLVATLDWKRPPRVTVTLVLATGVLLTVGDLRARFPSEPSFEDPTDAFMLESVTFERQVHGAHCQVSVTVPRARQDLDAIAVYQVDLDVR